MKMIINFLRNLRKFILTNRILLLSFLLPVAILEIAYICYGVFPFGRSDVLLIDLYHQYAPFISELQDKLMSFSSFFYSWSVGLGASFLPQFAYYLSSPLNLIIVFFPKEYLTEAILILILLKVGLAGLCFNIYLKGVHREQHLITAAFSLLYALSGFVLAYSWNIMWLDAIYLLPLVILGLVRLIRDGKAVLYCAALTLTLLSNFYIAFFVCLFTFLYFPVCLFQYQRLKHPGLLLKKTSLFAFLSLLSAGMSSILLLPTFFSLQLTSAATDVFPKEIIHYHDLFDYISRHFLAASPAIREGFPNVYCGIAILIFLPVYFFSRKIRLTDKLLHLALVSVLILSFNTNILNFIWHGFHFPNQLPFRFSFVYVFLVLSMSYSASTRLNEFSGKQIGTFCSILLVLILLTQKLDESSIGITAIYLSLIFVVLYAVVFTLEHASAIGSKYKTGLLFVVILAEICTNTILTIGQIKLDEGYTLRDGYASGTEVAQIRDQLSSIALKDNSFYRTEVYPPKTTNDPALYHYNGLSIFSSTIPAKPVKMMENLGYPSNGINSYTYEGSTVFLDSFFGIKYLLNRSTNTEEPLYQNIASAAELTVYQNPYVLPLGFLVPPGLKNWHSGVSNPFENQNNLMKSITGIKNIFTPVEQKQGYHNNIEMNSSSTKYYHYQRPNIDAKSTVKVQILNKTEQQVYLYLDISNDHVNEGFVMVGEKKVEFNAKHSTLVNLGFCKADVPIRLELSLKESAPESGNFQLYSYGLDLPEFENGISMIKKGSMAIDSFSDNRIKGSIDAETDGLMVITVPYDNGWHVKVDDQEVQTESIDDCLLSFEIARGVHRVELWFIPDKFFLSLMVSFVSLLLFGWIWKRELSKKASP